MTDALSSCADHARLTSPSPHCCTQWGEGHAGGVSSTRREGQLLVPSLLPPLTLALSPFALKSATGRGDVYGAILR